MTSQLSSNYNFESIDFKQPFPQLYWETWGFKGKEKNLMVHFKHY